jgi:hypothetical protein
MPVPSESLAERLALAFALASCANLKGARAVANPSPNQLAGATRIRQTRTVTHISLRSPA